MHRHLLHSTDGRESAVSDGEEMYDSASDDDNGSHLDVAWGSHDSDAGAAAAHSASRYTSTPCTHDSDSRYALSTESSTAEDSDITEGECDFDTDTTADEEKSGLKVFEFKSEILSPQELQGAMRKEAGFVSEILDVDISTAYLLLRSLAWDKERLVEAYIVDSAKVSTAAGVFLNGLRAGAGSSQLPRTQSYPAPWMCPTCSDDGPGESLSLGCKHAHCSNCWRAYLHTKIHDQGEVALQCMDESCKIQADDEFVRRAAATEDSKRYMELLVQDFVSNTPQIKFCPHPGCGQAVRGSVAATKRGLDTMVPTVNCAEHHEFCFGCSLEGGHRPVACSMSKMWLDEHATANWIENNTKECPKCQTIIEKQGGCDWVICKCNYECVFLRSGNTTSPRHTVRDGMEYLKLITAFIPALTRFCWACGDDLLDHLTEHLQPRLFCTWQHRPQKHASLERYFHYYRQWAKYEQFADLLPDLYAKTERKMEKMQVTCYLRWIDVQFAREAVDEIANCRMTLRWIHAMAYYLEEGGVKQLLEYHQAELEKAVEALSELLEMPISRETIYTLRNDMKHKTVYASKRHKIMLDDTAKGFVEGRWKWNVPALQGAELEL